MADYTFYISFLRFVANKTERETPDIAAMMDELNKIAEGIEAEGTFSVPKERMAVAARALAGVAGLLQQSILPEVVASENKVGEVQVRWVIDTSMELVAHLTTRAELAEDGEVFTADLPAPPKD